MVAFSSVQDLDVGQAGGVVDADVHELPAGALAAVPARAAAEDARNATAVTERGRAAGLDVLKPSQPARECGTRWQSRTGSLSYSLSTRDIRMAPGKRRPGACPCTRFAAWISRRPTRRIDDHLRQ